MNAKTRHRRRAAWREMIRRCSDPSAKDYAFYGARGIRVCAEWTSFDVFLRDVGDPPTRRHTLDRRDPNGHYEPGNVRWATRREQAINRRSTRMLTFRGRTLCVFDWARRLGIPQGTLDSRLNRLGWPVEKALSQPVQKRIAR